MTQRTHVRPLAVVALFAVALLTVAGAALIMTIGMAAFAQAQECIQYDWDRGGNCVEFSADRGPTDWAGKRGGGTASDVTLSGLGGYSGTVHFADGDVTFTNDNGTWINTATGYSSAQSLLQAIVVAGSGHTTVTTATNSAGLLTEVACNNGVTATAQYIGGACSGDQGGTYPDCSCPSGTELVGGSCQAVCVANVGSACSSAPNSCGMTNNNGTISCSGSCVGGSPPPDSQCSSGGGGTNCVQSAGQACASAPNICGMTNNSGRISCDGTSCVGSTPPSNALCIQDDTNTCRAGESFYCSAGNLRDSCTGGLVRVCDWGCSGGNCNASPSPTVRSFSVAPSLLRRDSTALVSWDAENVRSCTVDGSNGDHWPTTASAPALSGQETSSPIVARTSYTLTCRALARASPATITETRIVDISPVFSE